MFSRLPRVHVDAPTASQLLGLVLIVIAVTALAGWAIAALFAGAALLALGYLAEAKGGDS